MYVPNPIHYLNIKHESNKDLTPFMTPFTDDNL
jgi:hypothetical protein